MAAYHSRQSDSVSSVAVAGLAPVASRRTAVALARSRVASVGELFAQADLTRDLQTVEQLLLARTQSRSDLIAAAGEHIVRAGGKRLRAAIALLATRLGTYHLDNVIHAAAAVELIHGASLVHDDLACSVG
jgi:hypothetical protein